MKRFHIHVGVKNLEQSVQFYSTLFGQAPSKLKADYAKWMLDDPRVNFAISTRVKTLGVDHLGIQVESDSELTEIATRLKKAEVPVFDEGVTTCCYAESNKAWSRDPNGLAWETYQTMADAQVFHELDSDDEESDSDCCASDENESSCC